ncbi:phage tail terminator-like protein [Aureimonas ureilytica]|uniref:phage tail terminator-like protein n=1 Tax=Aureimonas ureilytica TaxID=401562 RepID=UPI003CFA8D57
MAHLTVVKAVESRLRAGFNACPIFVENSGTQTPDAGGDFLLVDFPFSDSRQTTIGSPDANRYMERGTFRVVLSIVSGSGAHQGREWLDGIATLFRGKSFDGVRTYAPQSPSTDDRNDVAGFFRLVLTVPYDFSLIG